MISNNIRNKLKDFNLGNLVVSPKKSLIFLVLLSKQNKRNMKDINFLLLKLTMKNKKLSKNRYKIEFTNNRLDKNMLKHIFLPTI